MASALLSKNPFDVLTSGSSQQKKQTQAKAPKKSKDTAKKTTTKPTEKTEAKPTAAKPANKKSEVPTKVNKADVVEKKQPVAPAPAAAPITERTPRKFDEVKREPYRAPMRGAAGAGATRQFDRHSATGRVDSERKADQRWTGDLNKVVEEGEAAAVDARRERRERRPMRFEQPAEPETPVKTLADFRKESRKNVPKEDKEIRIRKANEGIQIVGERASFVIKSSSKKVATLDPIMISAVKPTTFAKKPEVERKTRTASKPAVPQLEAERYRRPAYSNRAEETVKPEPKKTKKNVVPNVKDVNAFPKLL